MTIAAPILYQPPEDLTGDQAEIQVPIQDETKMYESLDIVTKMDTIKKKIFRLCKTDFAISRKKATVSIIVGVSVLTIGTVAFGILFRSGHPSFSILGCLLVGVGSITAGFGMGKHDTLNSMRKVGGVKTQNSDRQAY